MEFKSIIELIFSILALLIAIIGHEIMHGYVAYKYGDNTAKIAGRLTINPIPHIDPIGSVLLPLLLYISGASFLFGWAKPVPINEYTIIKNGGYIAAIYVSLAGIFFNLVVAILGSILYAQIEPDTLLNMLFSLFLIKLIIFNVVLAVLNAWIIPPLDGANALGYLGYMFGTNKIAEFNAKIGNYGMLIILFIIAIPQLSELFFAPAKWMIVSLLNI